VSEAIPSADATLADLERCLLRDSRHVVMSTAPGPETDLLSIALAERLAPHLEVVRIAAHHIGEDEFFGRILERLGSPPSGDPEAQLLRALRARGARGAGVVLLVRGADTLPPELLGRLGRVAAASERGLRLGLVVETDAPQDPAPHLRALLGVSAESLRIDAQRARALVGLLETRPGALRVGRGSPASEARADERRPRRDAASLRVLAVAAAGGAAVALALLGAQRADWSRIAHDVSAAPQRSASARVPGPAEPTLEAERAVASASETAAEATTPATIGPSAEPIAEASGHQPNTRETPSQPAPAEGAAEAAGTAPPETLAPPASEGAALAADESAPGSEPAAAPAVEAEPVRMARVSLNARPWARIQIDGRDRGLTPLADLPLEPGRHRLRAVLPGGRVVERALEIGSGDFYVSFP